MPADPSRAVFLSNLKLRSHRAGGLNDAVDGVAAYDPRKADRAVLIVLVLS